MKNGLAILITNPKEFFRLTRFDMLLKLATMLQKMVDYIDKGLAGDPVLKQRFGRQITKDIDELAKNAFVPKTNEETMFLIMSLMNTNPPTFFSHGVISASGKDPFLASRLEMIPGQHFFLDSVTNIKKFIEQDHGTREESIRLNLHLIEVSKLN
jgi:hypothetical protein